MLFMDLHSVLYYRQIIKKAVITTTFYLIYFSNYPICEPPRQDGDAGAAINSDHSDSV